MCGVKTPGPLPPSFLAPREAQSYAYSSPPVAQ